jgi:hypothetical protein
MGIRPALAYPLLFAVHPVLALAAANTGEFTIADLVTVAVASAIAFGCAYAVLALLLGRERRDWAALITLVAIVWFYYLVPLSRVPASLGIRVPRPFVATAALAAVLTLVLLVWLARRRPRLDRLTSALATAGVLLVAWSAVTVWRHEREGRSATAHSTLVRELGRPVPVRAGAADSMPVRDIYFIVLDELANSEILRERFAFDARAFDDSLRQLGFVVPAHLRSNYATTLLSLPSLLNFAHVTALEEEIGEHGVDRSVPRVLIANNRAARYLRGRGYRFIFFPSSWWRLTLTNEQADEEFQARRRFDVARELVRTEFRRTLAKSTLLQWVPLSDDADMGEHVVRSFEGIARVAPRPEPTFVFAHFISPHWPYVLDAECRYGAGRAPVPARAGLEPDDAAYVEQVKCIHRLTLALARRLVASSAPAPVVIFQADHGSKSLDALHSSGVPGVPALRERFGAFGAYYLPDGGADAFGDPPTTVNVLGFVLSYYAGADVRREPDSLYFSLAESPYDLYPIDRRRLDAGAPPPVATTPSGSAVP